MEVSNQIVETVRDLYDNITANQTLRNCKRRHFKLRCFLIRYTRQIISIWRNEGRKRFNKTALEKENVSTPIQPNMVQKRLVVWI